MATALSSGKMIELATRASHHRILALVTVLVSLSLSFLGIEVLLRLLSRPPTFPRQHYVRDPYLPYKPKPLGVTSGPPPSGGAPQEYRHNSFGFRDVEHAPEKGEHVFRILGLGDSFTYGSGATFEETYLYRLEAMLNGRRGEHPHVEIIKAGIPRYYPEPERILLENYGWRYSPDLILVGFLPNDVIDTYFGLNAVTLDSEGYLISREAAELGPVAEWLYKKSYVARMALRRYTDYRSAKRYQPHDEDVFRENGFHEKDWRKVESEFAKMAAIAMRLHSRLVLVYIPQQGPWGEEQDYPGRRLSAWASRNGVGAVDVLPGMMRAASATRQPLYYKNDGHCTPAGYAVVAQEIFDYLTTNDLVP